MTKIQAGSIVVGVDGSEHADRAVRWAAEQAYLERRPLVAVVAAEPNHLRGFGWAGVEGSGADVAEHALAGVRGVAESAAELARHWQPGVEATGVAVFGDPRQVLTDLSATAHLLVLGSRGRGAVRTMLLGSVSAAVSKAASCPVVVFRPLRHAPRDGIVVGVDGSPQSLPVIEFAFQQATLHRRRLTVLHSFWDVVAAVAGFREASGEVLNDAHLEEQRLLLAQSVAGFQEKYPDVEVSQVLRHGLVEEALVPRDAAWDLVVVGHQQNAGVDRLLRGAVATAVLEHAHGPVAVVPEAPAEE